MRIAQVISTYPPYAGGMGAVAAEYTKRLRARGHDVHVFTPLYKTGDIDLDFVHRFRTPLKIGNAAVLPQLYTTLEDFDVVHLHYPFFGGAVPVALARRMRRISRLVMTYHMDAVASGWKGGCFHVYERTCFPFVTRAADVVLSSSTDYAETSALARVPGVLDRVEELPFGIDTERFAPGNSLQLREQLQIPDGDPVLLFVGGMDTAHDFKGVPVLLDALERIDVSGWHAVLVGAGNLRASFEAQAQQRHYNGVVHFVGHVSDEALPDYYRLANIHLFPSTARAEAFGLVALEAAASGVPTIASDLPGVRSVVLDEQTGILVPPRRVDSLAKSMTQLLNDKQRRIRYGRAARKRAETTFAWKPLMDQLIEIYQR